ncbi:MAG: hypothetical protein HQM16_16540, partial [Deltaproteobacteria bacterium]|nr:hypothetical protein [Deltaproteobacteria bacterium]
DAGFAVKMLEKVRQGALSYERLESLMSTFAKYEIFPTEMLFKELDFATDPEKVMTGWKAELARFENGEFDVKNELHRNLEYTRFRRIVTHNMMKKHVKEGATFEEYLAVFDKSLDEKSVDKYDQFEIDCVAYEAKLLRDYIVKVAEQAKKRGCGGT